MLLNILVGLSGIVIGTLTDLKKREVPDWTNYGMLVAGLGLAVITSLSTESVWPLAFSLAGLGVGYGIGALMYYTGQWGGGDAKMMMGLGALLGIPILPTYWQSAPFFLVFLFWSVLAGAAYGLVWMLVLFVKHRKAVFSRLEKQLHAPKLFRVRVSIIVLAVLLIIVGLTVPFVWPLKVLLFVLAAVSYLTFYLALIVKAVEKTAFIKERPVEDLVEGDWVVGEVKRGKHVIVEENATGLTKEQLSALRKHKVKSVTIKEGIPFVPSFLFAYLIAWYWTAQGLSLLFWL